MKDFTLYPEASELKELGFDEPCIAWYAENKELQIAPDTFKKWTSKPCNNSNIITVFNSHCITAPTYSQAFRWFRETFNLHSNISSWRDDNNLSFSHEFEIYDLQGCWEGDASTTYEQAELACLKKMIEIVKSSQA
jgi:hypothetical protein